MNLMLPLNETRVIGVLIEKSATTPDQYPMSLNALTNACNQKTNREPVLNLSESEVQNTLDALTKKHLVTEVRFGSRVPKYQHRFCNTEFSEHKFNHQELALICVLFLRGPQTPGELRTRTNRQCSFTDVQETEAVLQGLVDHDNGPYTVKLERQPGKRESRYAHLFSGEVKSTASGVDPASHQDTNTVFIDTTDSRPDIDTSAANSPATALVDAEKSDKTEALIDRVEVLELTVEDLQNQIDSLKDRVDQLTS